jgi:surface antigen
MPALAAALTFGLMTSGCSFSYQLGSLFGKDEDKPEQTGSIAGPRNTVMPAAEGGNDGDLAYARAAASEVLSRGGKDASAPWTNPRTGARGTVTPLADAYTQDGFVCRDFLASYVRKGSEAWLQGEACRVHQGRWEVRKMRPWKKS